jgi:acyl transferase domain-containing protein
LVPDAVIGQSLGEVATAVVSGALSLDDGARVIVTRSLAVSTRSGKGAMAVVDLTLDEAAPLIARFAEVSVAVHLSPRELVLSGANAAMDAALAELEAAGRRCQRVAVDYASHCAEMDPLLQHIEQQLACVKPRAPRIPMWSTVRDGWVVEDALLDARYWCDNLRSPVLLCPAVEKVRSEGFDTFIEIGPHPVTLRSIRATLEAQAPRPRLSRVAGEASLPAMGCARLLPHVG